MSTSVLILGMRYSNFWLCYVFLTKKFIFIISANKGAVAESILYICWYLCCWLDRLYAFGKWQAATMEHSIWGSFGTHWYSQGAKKTCFDWSPFSEQSRISVCWCISFWSGIAIFFRPVLHTLIRGEWLWTPSVFYLSLGWVLSDCVHSFLCLWEKKGSNKNRFLRSIMTLPR